MNPDTSIVIMDADTIVRSQNMREQFIFVIRGNDVWYMDTAKDDFFLTEYPELKGLREAHKKAIRAYVKGRVAI